MTIRIFIISILIAISTMSDASAKRKKSQRIQFKEVEQQISNRNFIKASEILIKLLAESPEDAEFNYKLGLCYFNINSKKKESIDLIEKSIKFAKDKSDIPNNRYYYLGRAYHRNYRFPEALKVYNELLENIPADNIDLRDKISRQIEFCNNAIELVKKPVNISVIHLGDKINSKYSEHSPSITADEETMIFTSRRPGKYAQLAADGQYMEDIYISHKINDKWTEPLGIAEINTPGHDASISISADGQDLFIYKSTSNNNGDIYISHLDGDKWTKPFKLDEGINTSFLESHISISADAKTMYFTSNRPGGYGGMDIYKVSKLPNNKWGKAQNLGPTINTKYNEDGPFIHPNGKILFFSSAGHKSMGGLDIYRTDFENGSWTTPKNIGYPINSTEDDVYYMPTTDGKRAYLSSYRNGSLGATDIFLIKTPEQEIKGLFVLKGKIVSTDKSAIGGAIISVKYKGKNIGMYNTNKATGKFLFIVEAGKNYDIEIFAEGFKTFKTKLNVPIEFANKENNSVITLVPVSLKTTKEEGGYDDKEMVVDFKKSKIKEPIKTDKPQKIKKLITPKKERPAEVIENAEPERAKQTAIQKNSDKILDVEYKSSEQKLPSTYYTVQIRAMKFPVGEDYFVHIYDKANIKSTLGDDDITRYTYRVFENYEEALAMKKTCRGKGYHDAFIRTVINGQVVDVNTHFVSAGHTYTIQVMALSNPKPLYFFNDIGFVNQYIHNSLYRYTYKVFRNKREAKAKLPYILKNGYWDAFVRKSFFGESKTKPSLKGEYTNNTKAQKTTDNTKYEYTIQLASYKKGKMPEYLEFVNKNDTKEYNNYDGLTRLTYKKFTTYQEAKKELDLLRKESFPDAFIRDIAWYNK